MISVGDFLAVAFWIAEIGFFASACFGLKYGTQRKEKTSASS